MFQTTAPSLLAVLLWACLGRMAHVSAAAVSPEDAAKYAAAGHPLFRQEPLDAADQSDHDIDRDLQSGCAQRVVAVYLSEYDMDYKDGDFQIGVTPIYSPDNLKDSIGVLQQIGVFAYVQRFIFFEFQI